MTVDLIVHNAGELVTMHGPARARTGAQMCELGVIQGGAIAARNGRIVAVGASDEILCTYQCDTRVDARGALVVPGFVDCHTHLVHAGSRENELAMRVAGKNYLEILAAGGGIHSTVSATRAASEEELLHTALRYLDLAMAHGTTTVEIKSGYGLEPETELKILRVIREAAVHHPLDIVPTFLGPHAVPADGDRDEYFRWCCMDGLDDARDLAEFADIFVEDGAWSEMNAQVFLAAAKSRGYGLRVHAGQFNDLGAAGLAADLGAVTVDHLEEVSDDQADAMAESGTIGVMLPGAAHFLFTKYPDARRLIEHGVPLALGTDFNPGSSPTLSMSFVMSLAVLHLKMSPEEALCAATINAAHAVNRDAHAGSLVAGKLADVVILNAERAAQLPYYFGTNLVRTVVKAGKVVYGAERQ